MIASNEVQASFASKLQALQDAAHSEMLAPRNRLHLTHGLRWTQPANEAGSDGNLKQMSAEVAIPFARIVNGDLSLVEESVHSMFAQMHDEQQRAFYQLIGNTCDRTGNVVKGEPVNLAEMFYEMISKIEFSVSETGEVELPQIHTADAAPLIAAIESASPEFKKRMDELIERKKEKANQAEVDRRSKFREERE
ncbi:hypothetical protein ACOQFR_15545 [Arenimonas sp. MALMAid1274]